MARQPPRYPIPDNAKIELACLRAARDDFMDDALAGMANALRAAIYCELNILFIRHYKEVPIDKTLSRWQRGKLRRQLMGDVNRLWYTENIGTRRGVSQLEAVNASLILADDINAKLRRRHYAPRQRPLPTPTRAGGMLRRREEPSTIDTIKSGIYAACSLF